jgi:hypothetical protein
MSHNLGRPKEAIFPMPPGIDNSLRLAVDDEMKARIAATISRAYRTPIDPDAPNLLWLLADIFRQRSAAGWNTTLSPETTILVVDALDAYAPKPPAPDYNGPGRNTSFDAFGKGSAIYRLFRDGEIMEVAAWAQSTLVAKAAFDRLIEQYPGDRFMQKRGSWVERE